MESSEQLANGLPGATAPQFSCANSTSEQIQGRAFPGKPSIFHSKHSFRDALKVSTAYSTEKRASGGTETAVAVVWFWSGDFTV